MAMPRKKERNREIVRLRDKEGWTFFRIGKHFNITKVWAFQIYQREKKEEELGVVDKSA